MFTVHCVPCTGYIYRSWRYGYALPYHESLVKVGETDRNNACVRIVRSRNLMKKNSGSHETLREKSFQAQGSHPQNPKMGMNLAYLKNNSMVCRVGVE